MANSNSFSDRAIPTYVDSIDSFVILMRLIRKTVLISLQDILQLDRQSIKVHSINHTVLYAVVY